MLFLASSFPAVVIKSSQMSSARCELRLILPKASMPSAFSDLMLIYMKSYPSVLYPLIQSGSSLLMMAENLEKSSTSVCTCITMASSNLDWVVADDYTILPHDFIGIRPIEYY